ncbi:MAG: hypothetical protein F6K42_01515 [Leptolyngbya sp. SIO1D8]|nr:hypothetical protein [Leptolyngbya sp. SIO1D8]
MARLIPLFVIVALGSAGVIVFFYYFLVDGAALNNAYVEFSTLTQSPSELTTLFAAEAYQNIHRINFFAEGVWALQSAIFTAV